MQPVQETSWNTAEPQHPAVYLNFISHPMAVNYVPRLHPHIPVHLAMYSNLCPRHLQCPLGPGTHQPPHTLLSGTHPSQIQPSRPKGDPSNSPPPGPPWRLSRTGEGLTGAGVSTCRLGSAPQVGSQILLYPAEEPTHGGVIPVRMLFGCSAITSAGAQLGMAVSSLEKHKMLHSDLPKPQPLCRSHLAVGAALGNPEPGRLGS